MADAHDGTPVLGVTLRSCSSASIVRPLGRGHGSHGASRSRGDSRRNKLDRRRRAGICVTLVSASNHKHFKRDVVFGRVVGRCCRCFRVFRVELSHQTPCDFGSKQIPLRRETMISIILQRHQRHLLKSLIHSSKSRISSVIFHLRNIL